MQSNNARFFLTFFLYLSTACSSGKPSKKFSLELASDAKREKALIKYTYSNITENMIYIRGLLELNGKHTELNFEGDQVVRGQDVEIPKTDPNVMSLPESVRKEYGGTPLHNAAWHGNTRVVKLLLKHGAWSWRVAPTNYKGNFNTVLHMVIKARKASDPVGVVNLLRNNGANPNVGGGGHRHIPLTPLMILAMQKNWRPKLLGALLAFDNLDINKQSNDQRKTALFLAAQRGNYKMVRELLIYGADPNILDSRGFTALKIAIERGYFKTAGALCKAHANPFIGSPCAMHCLLKNILETKKKRQRSLIIAYKKLLTNLLAAHPVGPQTKEYQLMGKVAEECGVKHDFDQAFLRAQQKIDS